MKNTATPQVTTTPDFRALCAELLAIIPAHGTGDPNSLVVARARAALAAEPVGEGPTDEELLESAAKALGYKRIPIDHEGEAVEAYSSELLAFARAVLAKWGRPSTHPRIRAAAGGGGLRCGGEVLDPSTSPRNA
jgi:hypothetical protein